jgi:hypothetical protein
VDPVPENLVALGMEPGSLDLKPGTLIARPQKQSISTMHDIIMFKLLYAGILERVRSVGYFWLLATQIQTSVCEKAL